MAESRAHHLHCAVDGPAMETCPHHGPLAEPATRSVPSAS